MNKKYLKDTYLRNVEKYQLKFFDDKENDCYVVVKKILKIEKPFIVNNHTLKLMDDGYYLVEITPKNENYNLRVYLDEELNILQYYFDITLENGFDEESGLPYYVDLYIDVTITNGVVRILDLDELEGALKNKVINKSQYDLAESAKEKLLQEIAQKNNRYLNLNIKKYIKIINK